ncbi:endonuclease/exonuclease/phosphatase family protein [Actinoplanes sp. TFC3]|uniref:endonuclease/exonuclease/phosphatase family protein n=1 Tax=Actinoplanes sp. TFC3 TaxID=1710355 RepID=UPI0008372411|nr:endonuclease/exonuclease/phosphatase family protein [Actinoplanes sp. TFC3]
MDLGTPVRVRRSQRYVVLGAALWLAFVLAHWALNGRWWLWLVPSALPPLVFVAVPLLALLLARSRVSIALALAGLLLGLPYNGLSLHFGRSEPAGVRVFSWNTEFWDQQDDPAAFYRYLRAQNADVYLLQEYLGWDLDRPFDGQRPMDDLARLRAEFPGYEVVVRGELATLSRYPVVKQPPVAPDPLARGDSTADFTTVFRDAKVLRTDLRVGARTVSFYNAHIAVQLKVVNPLSAGFWNVPKVADPQRKQQLTGLWTDIAGNPGPVVLAGDFNTSPAMADLRGVPDRLHDANGLVAPRSWPASLPLYRLDWAFTTLEANSYELNSPDGLSDHRSQLFTLS